MGNKKEELSTIVVGEDTDIEQQIAGLPKREQKEMAKGELVRLANSIKELGFNRDKKIEELKQAMIRLQEKEFYKGILKLKREISDDKKRHRALLVAYMGGMNMINALGIKIDAKTLKEIKQLTDGKLK